MDGELLQPVRELLARKDPRVFIVLHTMGGHQHYSERYPPEFNHFGSRGTRMNSHVLHVAVSKEDAEDLTNSYDNSVLYTDWLLSQLIGVLRDTHAVTSLFYVSDHGENGADASFMPFDHGAVSADVMHVPFFIWLSPEYRQHRSLKAAALASHLDTPCSSDSTFHTIIDMAGLDCSLLDATRSLAGEKYQTRKRYARDLTGQVFDVDEKLGKTDW
jgi:glucan phosphoethanolaminetransferase (alkaline phosphatase superfamily)